MKIFGNTVGTTLPKPSWLQSNPKKGNYIFDKPTEMEVVRGYSAYQVAVMNGFEGTEAEWLESLKADPQGEQGPGNMVVTLDIDTETASHSSTEILEHLSGGGSVIAKIPGNGDFLDEYGHLWSAMDGEVAFYYLWVSSTDTTQYIYTVRADKSIGSLEQTMEPGSGSAEDTETQVTSISTVRDGQTITMTLTLADNTTERHVIALDSNDYPTSITVNGTAIPMEWSGFDV